MQEGWKTAEQIADKYQIKVATIRSWMRKGIPHLRCGRLVRFDLEKVQAWLESKQAEKN